MNKSLKPGLVFIFLATITCHAQPGIILRHHAGQAVYSTFDKTTDAVINKVIHSGKMIAPPPSGRKDSIPAGAKSTYQLPSTIMFDWEVVQKVNAEEGKSTHTYYFTTNGDYAGMRPDKNDDEDMSLMIYMKDGASLTFNETTKTITIMKMTRVVGEGGIMGKQVAEGINKKPLPTAKKNNMTLTKSGKTKMICGNIADEYILENEGGTGSVWYARVSFDPVKIYTMGAGRPADLSKIKNDPKMKNNLFAIPLLNKNCLMAEMEAGGQKGMETQSITKKTVVISTAGYKIKDFSNKGLKEIIQEGEN